MSDTGLHQLALSLASLDAVGNGLIILDTQGKVMFWNQWMQLHSGIGQAKALGKELRELFPELLGSRLLMAVGGALAQGQASLLSQSLNKAPLPLFQAQPLRGAAAGKERISQAIQVVPISVKGLARHCLIQITDVSFSVAREKLLRQQAQVLRDYSNRDSLTGIANRRHLDEHLEAELRRAIRTMSAFSVILIDIDYFKQYNDTYGHQMGDQCLVQVAAALKASLKRPGDMVARYGGEEFAVILSDTDQPGAESIARTLCAKVAALGIEHKTSAVAPHVTISLGVASAVPGRQCEPVMLLTAADVALYQAKRQGRNRVVIFEETLGCAVDAG
jgi:diguanylate cyclase (GGDEF)-like protein